FQAWEDFVDASHVPRPGTRDDLEMLLDRERGKHVALLRHPSQARVRAPESRQPRDVAALPRQRAALEPRKPHQGEQQGRLADSVATQQREASALLQLERNVLQYDRVAVACGQAIRCKQ